MGIFIYNELKIYFIHWRFNYLEKNKLGKKNLCHFKYFNKKSTNERAKQRKASLKKKANLIKSNNDYLNYKPKNFHILNEINTSNKSNNKAHQLASESESFKISHSRLPDQISCKILAK